MRFSFPWLPLEGKLSALRTDEVFSDLSVAFYDIFIGTKFFQTHRAARVELLRGDANLAALAKFPAVRKPRGRVDIHRRAVHAKGKFFAR